MNILLLGGPKFLGHAYIAEALSRGHQVTTFNRGQSGTDPDGIEAVRGDRTNPDDLDRLVDGRRWDAVIDTSGQQPHDVARSARLLRDRAEHYSFVSSVHAFADWPANPVDESSETHPCPADSPPDLPFATALKAGCERAVLAEFGERSSILNCGLLYGPQEQIGRTPWWLERIAKGGRVLAPGNPQQPMQLIDTRDFAAFGLDLVEQGLTGRFITTAPVGSTTYRDYLEACIQVTGSDAELVWTDDATLLAAEVEPWVELPLWTPELPDWRGTWRADSSRAQAAGLRCRPVQDTVRDTWEWLRSGGAAKVAYTQGAQGAPLGIAPEKEQAVLGGLSGD